MSRPTPRRSRDIEDISWAWRLWVGETSNTSSLLEDCKWEGLSSGNMLDCKWEGLSSGNMLGCKWEGLSTRNMLDSKWEGLSSRNMQRDDGDVISLNVVTILPVSLLYFFRHFSFHFLSLITLVVTFYTCSSFISCLFISNLYRTPAIDCCLSKMQSNILYIHIFKVQGSTF